MYTNHTITTFFLTFDSFACLTMCNTIISQDEGKTWATPKLIGTNVTRSDWKWVGTGPPGRYVDSVLFERLVWYTYLYILYFLLTTFNILFLFLFSLQLKSGRIIVPSYHSKVRGNLINNIVHGHVMLSDDNGASWRLGKQENGFGSGNRLVNENQAGICQNHRQHKQLSW